MATNKTTTPPSTKTTASSEANTPAKKKAPMGIIVIGVIGIVFVALAFATSSQNKVEIIDGKIQRQIAQVDQCTQSTFTVTVGEGGIEKAAAACFDALKSVPGVGLVTVYVDNPRIDVGYCESQQTPEVILAALAATGYVTQ